VTLPLTHLPLPESHQKPNMTEQVKEAVAAVTDKIASATIGSSSTTDASAAAQSQPNLQQDPETGEMMYAKSIPAD
jgi:hypothetical protein